jgi:thioesterase domain-containing protein
VTVATLLAELRSRDVEVWIEGDQLRCNAPAGVLTPDLRDVLRQRKRDMVEFLRSAQAVARQQRAIVPLQARGSHAPIFAVPGHNGDVFLYRPLAQHLGDDQPFFGLQPPGLDDGNEPLASVEDLAAYFARQIREFRSHGPYAVAGYCAGATIAYEIAQQLVRQGADVSFVAMFAGEYPTSYRRLPQFWERHALRLRRARKHLAVVASQSLSDSRRYIGERLQRIAESRGASDPILAVRSRLMRITAAAVAQYKPRAFDGRVCLVFPSHGCLPQNSMLRWHKVTRQIEEYYGADGCEGDVMLLEPYADATAELVRQCRHNRKI